jgi:hypothetical protein
MKLWGVQSHLQKIFTQKMLLTLPTLKNEVHQKPGFLEKPGFYKLLTVPLQD